MALQGTASASATASEATSFPSPKTHLAPLTLWKSEGDWEKVAVSKRIFHVCLTGYTIPSLGFSFASLLSTKD